MNYIIPVTYKSQTKAELEKQFDYVSCLFEGREFTSHESCLDRNEKDGEKEMILKHFERPINSEEAIKEMAKEGYRPATHLELIAFAKAHPELQRQYWIVALGSFALYVGYRDVAVLNGGSGWRYLGCGSFDFGWDADRRFLFVRKGSSDTRTLGPDTLTLGLLVEACEAFVEVLKKAARGE